MVPATDGRSRRLNQDAAWMLLRSIVRAGHRPAGVAAPFAPGSRIQGRPFQARQPHGKQLVACRNARAALMDDLTRGTPGKQGIKSLTIPPSPLETAIFLRDHSNRNSGG